MECIISFITIYKLPKLWGPIKTKEHPRVKIQNNKGLVPTKNCSWLISTTTLTTGNPHILLISVHAGLLKGHMCPGTVRERKV